MSDIKLFRTSGSLVTELEGKSVALEKSLQTLIESNLEAFLGIRFLATEYSIGKTFGGRIDTLGVDEDGWPCIIEYKRATNENVINQGLFYFDWLMDHKAEFELLVMKKLGQQESEKIDWSSPRLLCIAGAFTKYDVHAVQQINRNIELLRYIRFGEEYLMLELVNSVQTTFVSPNVSGSVPTKQITDKTVTEQLAMAGKDLLDVYSSLEAECLNLGDDVQTKTLKYYVAFKRMKNFATVDVKAGAKKLMIYVKVNPDTIELEEGFTKDVRNIGHWGTGDLEITIRNQEDLQKALPLLQKSYAAA